NALGFSLLTCSPPLTRRITAITNLDAQAVCSVAGLGQRDVSGCAQTDHLGLAIDPVPEQPASGALVADLEIEIVRDPMHADLAQRFDLPNRERSSAGHDRCLLVMVS